MDESLLRQYPELERDHFWWVSRQELVGGLIANRGSRKDASVLDVGCGSGMLARQLSESGFSVTGVDVASHSQWAESGGGELRLIEADYTQLASTLGTFDVVTALDVVEHIEDDRAFVDALKTNVRPGGVAIVTVPAYSWLWSRHDVLNHHYRRYNRTGLADLLTSGGFREIRCGYIFFGLIVPKLLANLAGRLWQGSDAVRPPPEPLNTGALAYFRWEHRIAAERRDFLPAGTSVVAVARRPT